ncbi:N-acetyltransferase [Rouxiella chamberiensis]|nr:N-acetyltransferase [Rouxiella chamberiensis]
MILLASPLISLRHFEHGDLDAFTRYRQDPAVARYQSWEYFTRPQAELLFEQMNEIPFGTPDNWFQIAIEHAESGMVGDFGLHFVDDYQVELGITLDPKWQGKGIAKSALNLLLTYLFDHLKKHRVYAVTDIRNHGSYRLFESAGFRREGCFLENCFLKGEWCSEYLYALLASEWEVRNIVGK